MFGGYQEDTHRFFKEQGNRILGALPKNEQKQEFFEGKFGTYQKDNRPPYCLLPISLFPGLLTRFTIEYLDGQEFTFPETPSEIQSDYKTYTYSDSCIPQDQFKHKFFEGLENALFFLIYFMIFDEVHNLRRVDGSKIDPITMCIQCSHIAMSDLNFVRDGFGLPIVLNSIPTVNDYDQNDYNYSLLEDCLNNLPLPRNDQNKCIYTGKPMKDILKYYEPLIREHFIERWKSIAINHRYAGGNLRPGIEIDRHTFSVLTAHENPSLQQIIDRYSYTFSSA
ncbi:hypothetical protein KC726_05780 [Candidatus Woesebacteria bacterium]|nr:hypothetical protein [Candidatus Woesebacteria bacterium]